ncbi:16S rRNA (guanine(527)-N(7))-methyltransferase RsmG [Rhodopseudomonas palustris]|uniref:Ribosomal RNA small subunit methyltransferase G n=1 Tax=Rhodopseudomonas palustris TaxID=1076 RepID=A0A323UET1_RHOPL|nr:16S rRNA (guanine(527)-N(7))-methyltransferase RsmG [Rhodopseudomonas palustris]PZA10921.1 16S rRNA (guanine(527)-N(7))-methyltransferase RsmG [Rhodopseudomonas palustris]
MQRAAKSLSAVSDLDADKAAAMKLVQISPALEARLDAYVALLQQWQAKTNLVAPSTLPQLWTRHVADSLQLVSLVPNARRWLDFGSGGGFPGVVLACAMADVGGHVTLVERIAKKAAFLREALRVAGAPGTVMLADIGDNVDRFPQAIDCITARAVAPLHQLIGFAEPLMTPGTTKALFLKGQDVEAELTEATKYWKFQPKLHASVTGGQGWIVEIESIERRT